MKPIFFPTPLQHRNFYQNRDFFIELVRNAPDGKVIALMGATQVGKSLIFQQLIRTLEEELRPLSPGDLPYIDCVVGTSNDGRVSPKHVTLKLLKRAGHPMYEHVGALDESQHYFPSRTKTESAMQDALEEALKARSTKFVLLDEAHHLTHTRIRDLREGVLDSIKCLSAITGTLVLVGGYELAYRGVFDSAHFAGRTICIELAPYTSVGNDLDEWERILKAFSKRMRLDPPTLLLEEAEALLLVTNGVFGLLEKLLWLAKALSKDGAIERKTLRAAFPPAQEHEVIRQDIANGRNALRGLNLVKPVADPCATKLHEGKNRQRPFKRKPNRQLSGLPKVAHD
jgi:AAA domain